MVSYFLVYRYTNPSFLPILTVLMRFVNFRLVYFRVWCLQSFFLEVTIYLSMAPLGKNVAILVSMLVLMKSVGNCRLDSLAQFPSISPQVSLALFTVVRFSFLCIMLRREFLFFSSLIIVLFDWQVYYVYFPYPNSRCLS